MFTNPSGLIIATYVDDLIIFGPRGSSDQLKAFLQREFELSAISPLNWLLSIQIASPPTGLRLDVAGELLTN